MDKKDAAIQFTLNGLKCSRMGYFDVYQIYLSVYIYENYISNILTRYTSINRSIKKSDEIIVTISYLNYYQRCYNFTY